MVSGHKISKLDLFNNHMQELWSSREAREYSLPSKNREADNVITIHRSKNY